MEPVSSQQALQELQTFVGQKQNPLDVYNQAQTQLGIPEIRQRVTGLRSNLMNTENLLNNLSGAVKGRTQGSLVTEAQRQRLEALERAPLTKEYSQMTGALGTETANLTDLLGQASTQANLTVQGESAREASLRGIFDVAFGREQQAEGVRQFNVREAENTRQFEAQQAARLKEFNAQMKAAQKERALTKLQITNARKQFLAQLAEEKRQFGISSAIERERIAASRASSGGGDTVSSLLSFLTGGSGSGGSKGGSAKPTTALAAAKKLRTELFKGGRIESGARERVFEALKKQYGKKVSTKKLRSIVFDQIFPNNWEILKAPGKFVDDQASSKNLSSYLKLGL